MTTKVEKLSEVVRDVRNYLYYLRALGVEGLPPAATSVTDSDEGEPEGDTLEKVRAELGDCKRCKLCHHRRHIVFGTGNCHARLVFVGEGPGRDEDIQGLPFVGAAGKMLTDIIEKVLNTKREAVYIANIIKCRPPNNRTPEPEEIAECYPFLEKQLEVINPRIIVALGNVAAQTLIGTKQGITSIRGEFHYYRGNTVIMPTYHPAYLLRNPEKKRDTWTDILKVKDKLKES
jgi:uracil-DNA glycosylase family 4